MDKPQPLSPVEDVYLVDNWDSVRLSDDLKGLSKFSKKCVVNVGDSEQVYRSSTLNSIY